MARQRRSRIYWRNGRAWADFRDFGAWGGRLEPLVAPGEKLATRDENLAERLLGVRLDELETVHRAAVLTGMRRKATLEHAVTQQLRRKSKRSKVNQSWVVATGRYLRAAVEYFGGDRELASVKADEVKRWLRWLKRQRRGRGQAGLADGSLRHYLNAFSNLCRTAQEVGAVPAGYNPCAAIAQKPAAVPTEAIWFENREAALLLEAARTYQPSRPDLAIPFAYPLLATFLLLGGRRAEVLGLACDDIDFDRRRVRFRSNRWRALNGRHATREVPLWPQLGAILGAHLESLPTKGLLFPSPRGRRAGGGGRSSSDMLWGVEKMLDRIAVRAGWPAGHIRTNQLRNTYCAERLHTVEGGQPIGLDTVATELGHSGLAMVQRIAKGVGDPRRVEVVEYDVERYPELLEQLASLRLGWAT